MPGNPTPSRDVTGGWGCRSGTSRRVARPSPCTTPAATGPRCCSCTATAGAGRTGRRSWTRWAGSCAASRSTSAASAARRGWRPRSPTWAWPRTRSRCWPRWASPRPRSSACRWARWSARSSASAALTSCTRWCWPAPSATTSPTTSPPPGWASTGPARPCAAPSPTTPSACAPASSASSAAPTAAPNPEEVERLSNEMAENDPLALARPEHGREELTAHPPTRITVPVTLVAGGEDRLAPPHAVQHLAAAIPGCRYVELPGVGHVINVEAAAAFTALVREVASPGLRQRQREPRAAQRAAAPRSPRRRGGGSAAPRPRGPGRPRHPRGRARCPGG